jgi:hypothetical protein
MSQHMLVIIAAGVGIGVIMPSMAIESWHERRHKGGICSTTRDFKPED